MNRVEESRLSMYLTVKGYCQIEAISAILIRLKGFTALLQSFIAIITKIQTIRMAQEYDFSGVTRTKEQTKKLLIKKVLRLIKSMKAYAKGNDLLELFNAVNYSKSDLEDCADTVLTDRCRIVTSGTVGHMEELDDYEVTPATVTEINTLVDEFTGDLPKPRLGFVNRKAATTALKEAFKEGTAKLEEIDILVDMLSDSDDEVKLNVYNGYKNARIIVNTGSRKRRKTAAVWGMVIDFETALPIAGARVSIPGTSIVVVTLEDGSFRIALKSFGIYQLRIEMDGYKMHLEDEINVIAEMEEVVIELEKVTTGA